MRTQLWCRRSTPPLTPVFCCLSFRWHASDALDADGYGSDGPSEASGLDERSSSQAADDSYRDVYGMAMHVGLAKPAPLVTTMAMSYEEAAMHLSGSSFGGLSLH